MLCEVLSVFEAHFEIFRFFEYCLRMCRSIYQNVRIEVYFRMEEVARRFDIVCESYADFSEVHLLIKGPFSFFLNFTKC